MTSSSRFNTLYIKVILIKFWSSVAPIVKDLISTIGNLKTISSSSLFCNTSNASGVIASNKKFLNHIKRISKYFFLKLNKIKKDHPKVIKEIRGKGLLIGIQLHVDQNKFIKKLMDNKLLTIRAAENVVRILPPLNVKKNEIEQALKIIKKTCMEIN